MPTSHLPIKISLFILAASWLLLAIPSNGQNRQAVRYNNALVAEQHKVVPSIVAFFEEHMKHGCSLEKALHEKEHIEFLLDKGIIKVSKMASFQGNDSLRLAALEWLKIYKYTFDVDFETAIPLLAKKDKNPEELETLHVMQARLFDEEDKIDREFENAQMAFARRYHLDMIALPLEASK